MTPMLLIILADALIILLLLLITLIVLAWRRKKFQHAQLEALLEQVANLELARKKQLIRYLCEHQQMAEQAATELSADFLEAEKQFLYVYTEQQLGCQPVSGFYTNVCQLLDKYLQLLPDSLTAEEEQKADSAKQNKIVSQDKER